MLRQISHLAVTIGAGSRPQLDGQRLVGGRGLARGAAHHNLELRKLAGIVRSQQFHPIAPGPLGHIESSVRTAKQSVEIALDSTSDAAPTLTVAPTAKPSTKAAELAKARRTASPAPNASSGSAPGK